MLFLLKKEVTLPALKPWNNLTWFYPLCSCNSKISSHLFFFQLNYRATMITVWVISYNASAGLIISTLQEEMVAEKKDRIKEGEKEGERDRGPCSLGQRHDSPSLCHYYAAHSSALRWGMMKHRLKIAASQDPPSHSTVNTSCQQQQQQQQRYQTHCSLAHLLKDSISGLESFYFIFNGK